MAKFTCDFILDEERFHIRKDDKLIGYASHKEDGIHFCYRNQVFTHEKKVFNTEDELLEFIMRGGKLEKLGANLEYGC